MKMIKRILLVLASVITLSLALTSCATSVGFRITRPAELDLNGAKTIAVLPFKPYAYYNSIEGANGVDVAIRTFFQALDKSGPDEQRAINYLHNYIEEGLSSSPYIKVVSADSVQVALKEGYINPADVYLTGEIINYYVTEKKSLEKIKVSDADPETGKKAEYIFEDRFSRYVEFDYRYMIIDSATEKVISSKKTTIHLTSSKYNYQRDLPSAYSIIQSSLASQGNQILRELQPYVITKSVRLIEDKSKDKELHKQMKNAHKLAKDGHTTDSYNEFTRIYKETDLFEAGYNAALLQEALGNLSTAEKLMSALYEKNRDSRAANALDDIRYEIRQAKRLKSQTEEKELTLD